MRRFAARLRVRIGCTHLLANFFHALEVCASSVRPGSLYEIGTTSFGSIWLTIRRLRGVDVAAAADGTKSTSILLPIPSS